MLRHHAADGLAELGTLGDPLGHDMPRAGQRFIRRGDLLFCADESGREPVERHAGIPLLPKIAGQRLQPLIARNGRLGPPLGLVRQIQVFQLVLFQHGRDPRAQFRSELALLADGVKHGAPAIFQLAKVLQLFLNGADLHLVQIPGDFFAVARNEGNRAAVVQQSDGGRQAGGRHAELHGDVPEKGRGKRFARGWCRHGSGSFP